MSLPTEFDFMIVKIGDGEATETFTAICGIENVQINEVANTSDRYVRDCAKPGAVPNRKTKTTGKQVDITGNGFSNADEIAGLRAALGIVGNYQIEGYQEDGTDTGALLGTYAGAFNLTANNLNVPRDGDATMEITLASDGAVTYTAAP